jgi:hypothetical protein
MTLAKFKNSIENTTKLFDLFPLNAQPVSVVFARKITSVKKFPFG